MQVEPIVLVIILLIGIVIMAIAVSSGGSTPKDEWKQDLRTRSNRIRNQLGKADSTSKKQLLIEADKLLDHTFIKMKVPGKDLGGRLKAARIKFDKSSYQNVWDAHKARNALVHELDYKITDDEIKLHVKNFLQAINKLTD